MKVVAYYYGDQQVAQRHAVQQFCQANRAKVIDEFSDKNGKDWFGIREAVAAAQQKGAKLVIGRYFGLARKLVFHQTLLESGLDFHIIDQLDVNSKTIKWIVKSIETMARESSEKIKEGIAKSGKKEMFGFANKKHAAKRNTKKLTEAGSKKRQQLAEAAYMPLVPEITKLRDEGWSFDRIAAHLNEQGYCTTRGKPFVGAKLCVIYQKIQGRKPTKRQPLDPAVQTKILDMDKKGFDTGQIATWLNEKKYRTTTDKEWDCETVWRVLRQLKGLPRKLQAWERKA